MRLFIAVDLPEEVTDALCETSAVLRDNVKGRYVASDSFHVTLAFLGEVEASRVDQVAAALEEGCRDVAAFEVALGELGSFGRAKSATLWQGFAEEGSMQALASGVRRALKDAGFSFDGKKFLPHITLMRKADISRGTLPAPQLAYGVVETVTLYRSDLSGSRPRYIPLHTVTLCG